jgi:hypothetical protein
MVDKDDRISMAGKNGVEIYIDGRPSPLRGTDLANYLRSLQSSSIESIEFITEPSAKYEASGNAGIINIKLKKDKSLGTNGSVTAGYNQGYFPKYYTSINLNHRNKKTNLFGSYTYYNGGNHSTLDFYREQMDSIFDQRSQRYNTAISHNIKTGMDFFLNKKNTFGVLINGNFSTGTEKEDGPLYISDKATNTINRILNAQTDFKAGRNNVNFNANYRYTDTSGRELNMDADYGFYDLTNKQYLPNTYYQPDGVTEISKNIYRVNGPTNIDIYSFKIDYEQKFGKGKLGFGGKTGLVQTKNNSQRFNVINNIDELDRDRSNRFNYSENINALYVNYNRPFKKFSLQAGLRAEHTVSKGRSTGEKRIGNTSQFEPYDSSLNKQYIDFFPSASLSFSKNPASQWSLSYSRRVDRPRYERLNPFEFWLNDYLYSRGNTDLMPQYTNSFSITNTYKYKLTTKLSYSHVRNMFTEVFEPSDTKMYQTTKNLNSQDVTVLTISYPFTYKTFMSFSNLSASYSRFNANLSGNKINTDIYTLQYYIQNTYKFGKKKNWTAELTGLYLSPYIWQAAYKSKALGFVDAGLQKTVLKGKGTVKASFSDLFNTMKFLGEGSYAGVYNRVASLWESQQLKLNFTYRFGSNQVKAARQRKLGIEEEASRTAGGNNSPGQ